MFKARWVVDLIVADRDHAIIDWTLFWTPPRAPDANRDPRGGVTRIAEIRAFYQQREERSTELEGFD